MRKALLLILTFIISLSALADGINVAGFRLLDKDMTANTHGTIKTDNNGETAALIKIVTLEQGFVFDGGLLGIVGTEYKNGEIWLYVPRYAKKITISHKSFGVLRDYSYPIPIQGGRTYEMLLDVGIGRYVTITTSRPNSDITIDDEYIGKSPIINRYMTYGKHKIVAQKDLYEGNKEITIVPTDDNKGRIETIEMQDMSRYYGDVAMTVDNNAEIYFNGRLVGKGSWNTKLRQGNYTVETRKADCDPVKTQFSVKPQTTNSIKADAPIPYTGYLSIYTRPANTKIYYNGREIDLQSRPPLPIGTCQIDFVKKGYISKSKEYPIYHNKTTSDTITLQRVNYVKPKVFYFGGGYSFQTLTGATGIVGLILWNNDIQASYTFGLTASDPVYWNGDMNTGTTYKMNSISVKYGFQIALARQFGFTPQIGYIYNTLTAQAVENGNKIYGDKAKSEAISVGAKFTLVPVQHLNLFIAPEYSFKLSQDGYFKAIAECCNFKGEGFGIHAGLLISF